jgi:hypothetical protein
MFEHHTIPRTPKYIDAYVSLLNDMGVDYKVRHGTYTTKIEHPNGIVTFASTNYRPQVFMAYNMLRKDIMNSEKAQAIMKSYHDTKNYNNKPRMTNFNAERVLNLDISGAYAAALMVNGLISEKTYAYLQSLQKTERLVSVGMLAKGYTEFQYENGKCVNVKAHREKTAQIFFYLIQEINYVMTDIQFYLGSDFIFYWVDGIFFKYSTPSKKIKEIEQLLIDGGYKYKYEDCRDFKYEVENEKHVVTMIKSDEFKRYEFRDNSSRDILQAIYEQSKKTNNKLFPTGTKGLIRKSNGFCDPNWKQGLDENAIWD